MPGKDIIVIGASAGGIGPIRTMLAGLPPNFAGSIFVVVHTSPDAPGILDIVLSDSALPVTMAGHNERIVPGHVYVARPDHHLIIEPGKVMLFRGPRENRFRPAVDPLFRSAAQTYGPRVVGIILSGGLDDGVSGLWTVQKLGGTTIVQDPHEAAAPSMPVSAMQHVPIDHVLPVAEIPPLLARLAVTPADAHEGDRSAPEEVKIEAAIARGVRRGAAVLPRLHRPRVHARGSPRRHGRGHRRLALDGAAPGSRASARGSRRRR